MPLRSRSKSVHTVVALVFGSFLLSLLTGSSELRAQSPAAASSETQPATISTQPTPAQSTPPAASPQPPQDSGADAATRDVPSTLKVRVNLVLVRVVVRDDQGRAVGNLRREDFLLYDRKKLQSISTFAVETPATHALVPQTPEPAPGEPAPRTETVPSAVLPQRFAALLFDDLHLEMSDAMQVRIAATQFLDALQPSDWVAVFTTSGQFRQDFTQDRGKIRAAIMHIVPHPILETQQHCPDMSTYQADLITNHEDSAALQVATYDLLYCRYGGDRMLLSTARQDAQQTARTVQQMGEVSAQVAFRGLVGVIQGMTILPGQRTIVLVSPGFYVTSDAREYGEIIDRALRANVMVNAIDARGLYVSIPGGEASHPHSFPAQVAGMASTIQLKAQLVQADVLATLAQGTGGTFFHNRNDLGEGMRRLAAGPEFSYVLGFSPQGLKFDGAYHELKVTLATKAKYSVQARRGYFAPRTKADTADAN